MKQEGPRDALRPRHQELRRPQRDADIDELYRYSARAEALGFDRCGHGPRHPRRRAIVPDPGRGRHADRHRRAHVDDQARHRRAGAAAAQPTVAAKAIGTLDVISKGRLILGVAADGTRASSTPSVCPSSSAAAVRAQLDILTRLWTKDRVTLQADEFNLREAVMRPGRAAPAPAHPDRWLRRRRAQARRHEGRRLADVLLHPGELHESWEKIVGFARGAGRDPKTLTGTNQLAILVGKSRAETEAPMRSGCRRSGTWRPGANRRSSTRSAGARGSASSSSARTWPRASIASS